MIATSYSRRILSYGGLVADSYTHEALKQLANKTLVGQYCVRLSCGYSRGIKVISKQNIKAKIALPSWIFTKTDERVLRKLFYARYQA